MSYLPLAVMGRSSGFPRVLLRSGAAGDCTIVGGLRGAGAGAGAKLGVGTRRRRGALSAGASLSACADVGDRRGRGLWPGVRLALGMSLEADTSATVWQTLRTNLRRRICSTKGRRSGVFRSSQSTMARTSSE
eukprot:scaffold7029_cov375-Pinguiococcus_pyrenoidosus.AAC.18